MQTGSQPAIRRYDLDWLRVFAVAGVFLYHSAHFFDPGDWSIKNATTYAWLGDFMRFFETWAMPLIFLISGASVYFAVRRGSPAGFLRARALRLLVPLLIGIFIFSPLQVYLERVSHRQFVGSFVAFLPHFFEGSYEVGGTGNFAWHGMHLWYLLFLLIFTFLTLPLFWWLRGASGGRVLRLLGAGLALPGAALLLPVPTIVLQNLKGNGWALLDMQAGGWSLPAYLWFFCAGFLIISHAGLQQRIIQGRWIWLALGLALVVLAIVRHTSLNQHPDVMAWFWLLAILGFGMRHLKFANRWLAYAGEAVLPFYILHQNVLLVLGFFVMPWAAPDLLKWLSTTAASLALIILLYEGAVRRVGILRYAFGMKSRRRPVPAPAGRMLSQGA